MLRVWQCSAVTVACASSSARGLLRRRRAAPAHTDDSSRGRRHQASRADEAADVGRGAAVERTSASSPLQQLYKSSHKGSGTRPLPSLQQATPSTRAVRTTATTASTAVAAAAPSVFATTRSSCVEDAGPVPERALSPLQRRQLQLRNKAAFVLTPQALRRVRYLLDQYKPRATASGTAAAGAVTAGDNNDAAAAVQARPTGIRIGVRRRGCSGYSYTVNYYFGSNSSSNSSSKSNGHGDAAAPARRCGGVMDDVVVEQDGVQVVVAGDALFYVIGTQMDYVVRDVEEKFVFANPNKKYSCGCEESFMPYDEDDMDD